MSALTSGSNAAQLLDKRFPVHVERDIVFGRGRVGYSLPSEATWRDLRLDEPADHHAGLIGAIGAIGAIGVNGETGSSRDADLTLEVVERQHILRVLAGAGGRVDAAAVRLAIPRSTLYQKLKQYRAAGH